MIFHSYVSLPEGNNCSNSLGGWWFTYPSENMSSYEFVSWDDYSQYMEKIIQMFQTTNQSWWFVDTLPNSLTLGGINGKQIQQSLVGGFNPSEKYEFVSWDDEIPNRWKIIKKNMFQTTNKVWDDWPYKNRDSKISDATLLAALGSWTSTCQSWSCTTKKDVVFLFKPVMR